MPKRRGRDEFFLGLAIRYASRSTCLRARVGAVLVKDRHIISTGYNGSAPGFPHCTDVGCYTTPGPDSGCKRTIHAEMNALLFSAKLGISTEGSIMYCTHSPCLQCALAMKIAGIEVCKYGESYRATPFDYIASDVGLDLERVYVDD